MGRADLVDTLVEQKKVGGKDDDKRHQYANAAIRWGLISGYLSENGHGTMRWIPGIRKSRMRKKL